MFFGTRMELHLLFYSGEGTAWPIGGASVIFIQSVTSLSYFKTSRATPAQICEPKATSENTDPKAKPLNSTDNNQTDAVCL